MKNFWSVVKRNQRRYGGFLVHISMVIIIIGITASSLYVTSKMFTVNSGETYSIEEYTLVFEGIEQRQEGSKIITSASLKVLRDDKKIHEATPSIEFYTKLEDYQTRVYVFKEGLNDFYIIPLELGKDKATFKVQLFPLINLIWIGSFLMIISTVLAMAAPEKKSKSK